MHYYVNRNSYSLWGYLTAFSCVNLMTIKKKNCKVFKCFSLSFKFFHLKGPRLVLQWWWSASSEHIYVNLHIFSSTKRLVERRWRGKKNIHAVMFGCSSPPLKREDAAEIFSIFPWFPHVLLQSCVLAFLRNFTWLDEYLKTLTEQPRWNQPSVSVLFSVSSKKLIS